MSRSIWALLMLLALPVSADTVRELTWKEMVPAGSPTNRNQPVTPMHDPALASTESAPPAAQQSPDAPVVKALDGEQVRLPGYIVPIDIAEDGKVSKFLLVPYFGACIHVPPPPANQIVYVQFAEGVLLDELYQPFWIEGPLQAQAVSSEIAEAGYQMRASRVYSYDDDN